MNGDRRSLGLTMQPGQLPLLYVTHASIPNPPTLLVWQLARIHGMEHGLPAAALLLADFFTRQPSVC